MTPIKYKVCPWLNTSTKVISYGIDVKVTESEEWLHVLDDNGPLFYSTEKAARIKVKELNKHLNQQQ